MTFYHHKDQQETAEKFSTHFLFEEFFFFQILNECLFLLVKKLKLCLYLKFEEQPISVKGN